MTWLPLNMQNFWWWAPSNGWGCYQNVNDIPNGQTGKSGFVAPADAAYIGQIHMPIGKCGGITGGSGNSLPADGGLSGVVGPSLVADANTGGATFLYNQDALNHHGLYVTNSWYGAFDFIHKTDVFAMGARVKWVTGLGVIMGTSDRGTNRAGFSLNVTSTGQLNLWVNNGNALYSNLNGSALGVTSGGTKLTSGVTYDIKVVSSGPGAAGGVCTFSI